MLHALALIIAAIVIIDRPGAGAPGRSVEVELAILPADEQADGSDPLMETEPTPIPIDTAELPELTDTFDLSGSPDATDLDLSAMDGIESLTGTGDSEGDAGLFTGSGGARATFFGVSARGTRFAYIVDISASMRGVKWDQARRALERSVDDLPDYTSFSVVLFQNDPILPGKLRRPKWQPSKLENKSDFRRWVRGVKTGGATRPVKAFTLVMDMKPRPDAIYFLTDGEFGETAPDTIAELNRQGRSVTIHTIAFVSEEGAHLLRRIAEDSGGTYRFVPGDGP